MKQKIELEFFTHRDIPENIEHSTTSCKVCILLPDLEITIGYFDFENLSWCFDESINDLYFKNDDDLEFVWFFPPKDLLKKHLKNISKGYTIEERVSKLEYRLDKIIKLLSNNK